MSRRAMRAAIMDTVLSPASPRQLPLPLPYLPPPPSPPLVPLPALVVPAPPAVSSGVSFQSRISPSVLLIILILAVIFFVSGLLHLLVRFLFRPAPRDPRGADGGSGGANATAFHGQLQQLFHLHDSGVDQSFIDALPVFLYRAVVGAGGKDPFDCAVCLCEFAGDDRLRLLPKCSHAFHVECIDTWLLSHSTCPLCRRSLLADFSPCGGGCSPLVFLLESDSESEGSVSDRRDGASSAHHLSLVMEREESWRDQKHAGAAQKDAAVVVPVKLGKFRSQATDAGVAGGGNPDHDVRRCYSMGTYEYVMDRSALLRVSVKPSAKKRPAAARHRVAMSECDCHSKREGFDAPPKLSKHATIDTKESFSISKIWMRRKEGGGGAATSGSSFRLPWAVQRAASDVVVSPVTESEYNVSSAWDKSVSGSVVDSWVDVEVTTADGGGGGDGGGDRLSSRADEAPSFARRTLLWIRGHL